MLFPQSGTPLRGGQAYAIDHPPPLAGSRIRDDMRHLQDTKTIIPPRRFSSYFTFGLTKSQLHSPVLGY